MNYFPLILSACLIIALILRPSQELFSQSAQSEKKIEINNSKKTKYFNEDGYVKGITTARAIGLLEMLLGISSIAFAVRAKKRFSITGAKTALALGSLAGILGIVHFITTSGAVFGSGSGKAGSILAIILGLVGCMLGGRVIRTHKPG